MQLVNSLKTPKAYNVVLLLMDYEEVPLIVEITQLAYSKEEAQLATQKIVDHFNYKYSCSYKIDTMWEVKKEMDFSKNGKPVEHYQVDITKAGEMRNWNHMKMEYDFIQTHYVHNQLNLEG